MRRIAPIATVLALAALLPTPVARAQGMKAPEIEGVPDGITRLLGDYGRAFERKDRELLLRTLAGSLMASEARALENTREIPFRQFRVDTKTQYSGNLAYRRVRALYPGKEVATYHVTEKTALDIESLAYEDDGAYTFVRDGPAPGDTYDGWRLTSKGDLEVIGFHSPYHLWDKGPVAVLRSEHFALLTHPEVADEMRGVIDVAERAYAKARGFWPRPVNEKYVILVPATTEELSDIMHATIDLGKFVAFVSSAVNLDSGWQPTGPRLFVHLSHLRNYNADGRLEIIAHELLHAITRPLSGPHIPVWVEEGLANAGGGAGARPSRAKAGGLPEEFPPDEEFLTGPVGEIIIRYDQSQVAIEALVDAFGREALAKFYEELGSARIVAGLDAYHVRRAIGETLPWSEEDWIAAWRKRIG